MSNGESGDYTDKRRELPKIGDQETPERIEARMIALRVAEEAGAAIVETVEETSGAEIYRSSDRERAATFWEELDISTSLHVDDALHTLFGHAFEDTRLALVTMYLAKCNQVQGLDPKVRYDSGVSLFLEGKSMGEILKELRLSNECDDALDWNFSESRLRLVRHLMRLEKNIPEEFWEIPDENFLQIPGVSEIIEAEEALDMKGVKIAKVVRAATYTIPGLAVTSGVGLVFYVLSDIRLENIDLSPETLKFMNDCGVFLIVGSLAYLGIKHLAKGKKKSDKTSDDEAEETDRFADESPKPYRRPAQRVEREPLRYQTLAEEWDQQLSNIKDEYSGLKSALLKKRYYKKPSKVYKDGKVTKRISDEDLSKADIQARAQVALRQAEKTCAKFKPKGIVVAERSQELEIGRDLNRGFNLGKEVHLIVQNAVKAAQSSLNVPKGWDTKQAQALANRLKKAFDLDRSKTRAIKKSLIAGERSFTEIESELNPNKPVVASVDEDDAFRY